MKYLGWLLIAMLGLFTTVQAQNHVPIKGVWLTNTATNALQSRANIKEAVATCKKYGINTIFMVVWNKGYTLYQSKVMQQAFGISIDPQFGDRDPLQELITEASKKHIAVHAWFEFGFAAAYDTMGGHILQKHPDWTAIDNMGRPLVKNHFHWLNGLHPEVQHFMQSLMEEVVTKYKVAGVQGDDRLPAMPSEGGYDAYTVSEYKKEHLGSPPPLDTKDTGWINWRCNRLGQFQQNIYQSIKKINPNILVTTAPSIFPWGKQEYLQDWPSWLQNGSTDAVFVQLYRYKFDDYQNLLTAMVAQADDLLPKVYPGVLISLGSGYVVDESVLQQMINANRKAGIKGEIFFYYEGLKKLDHFFSKTYQKL